MVITARIHSTLESFKKLAHRYNRAQSLLTGGI